MREKGDRKEEERDLLQREREREEQLLSSCTCSCFSFSLVLFLDSLLSLFNYSAFYFSSFSRSDHLFSLTNFFPTLRFMGIQNHIRSLSILFSFSFILSSHSFSSFSFILSFSLSPFIHVISFICCLLVLRFKKI